MIGGRERGGRENGGGGGKQVKIREEKRKPRWMMGVKEGKL